MQINIRMVRESQVAHVRLDNNLRMGGLFRLSQPLSEIAQPCSLMHCCHLWTTNKVAG